MARMQSHDDLASEVEHLKDDLASVRSDIREIANLLLNEGRAKARQTRDDIEERLNEGVDSARGYVRERPFATVLTAFGAGMLLAAIASRR